MPDSPAYAPNLIDTPAGCVPATIDARDPATQIAAELRETNRLLGLIAERLSLVIDRAAAAAQPVAKAAPVYRTVGER
jgi:hypothetical protein